LGKWIVIIGLIVVAVGAMIWLAERVGIPFGNLPGDVKIEGSNYSFRFPVVTSIIVSIVLTLLINIFIRFFR
jgi:hypothetical protein